MNSTNNYCVYQKLIRLIYLHIHRASLLSKNHQEHESNSQDVECWYKPAIGHLFQAAFSFLLRSACYRFHYGKPQQQPLS